MKKKSKIITTNSVSRLYRGRTLEPPDETEEERSGVELNFRDPHTGNFYIHGPIDESIPKNIIGPLLGEIEARVSVQSGIPIRMFITSPGGLVSCCFDIIALFDYAASLGVEIHTVVTSCAASAGSLIAVCGHKRFVGRRAYHLLHYARSWDFSHNPEMSERNNDNIIWLQDELIKIYSEKTKLKEKELRSKLMADNFMINGAQNLKRLGLADAIFEG